MEDIALCYMVIISFQNKHIAIPNAVISKEHFNAAGIGIPFPIARLFKEIGDLHINPGIYK